MRARSLMEDNCGPRYMEENSNVQALDGFPLSSIQEQGFPRHNTHDGWSKQSAIFDHPSWVLWHKGLAQNSLLSYHPNLMKSINVLCPYILKLGTRLCIFTSP